MTVKTELLALAKTVAKRAGDAQTPFAEAVDAVKALTVLYATLLKDKGKSEDESDGFTMADAQASIEEHGHGETAVRGRSRRSAASN